jgi:hypothetical protein
VLQIARAVDARVAVLEEGVRARDLVRLVDAALLVFGGVEGLVDGGVLEELEQPGEGKLSVLRWVVGEGVGLG